MSCALCDDTGWEPTGRGSVRRCACRTAQDTAARWAAAGVPTALRGISLRDADLKADVSKQLTQWCLGGRALIICGRDQRRQRLAIGILRHLVEITGLRGRYCHGYRGAWDRQAGPTATVVDGPDLAVGPLARRLADVRRCVIVVTHHGPQALPTLCGAAWASLRPALDAVIHVHHSTYWLPVP